MRVLLMTVRVGRHVEGVGVGRGMYGDDEDGVRGAWPRVLVWPCCFALDGFGVVESGRGVRWRWLVGWCRRRAAVCGGCVRLRLEFPKGF